MSKHNPQVNTFVQRDAFDESYIWEAEQNEDFMMAFVLTNFINGEVKEDPKFVKWYAEYVIHDEGEVNYEELPMHRCTEEEMARFHPPTKKSAGLVKKYKELNAFMCLDMKNVVLYGEEPSINMKTIDIMLLPCMMKETMLGGKVDRIPDECNWDRDELVKYLGPLSMLIYKNEGSFQLD